MMEKYILEKLLGFLVSCKMTKQNFWLNILFMKYHQYQSYMIMNIYMLESIALKYT